MCDEQGRRRMMNEIEIFIFHIRHCKQDCWNLCEVDAPVALEWKRDVMCDILNSSCFVYHLAGSLPYVECTVSHLNLPVPT